MLKANDNWCSWSGFDRSEVPTAAAIAARALRLTIHPFDGS
jgi:hypothetical protein